MAICSTCGNNYDNCFEIELKNHTYGKYTFDCFECAIHKLAPVCNHCGCRVIGHGQEGPNKEIYCSAHCARQVSMETKKEHLK